MNKKYLVPFLITVSVLVGTMGIKYSFDKSKLENEEGIKNYEVYSYLSSDVVENAQKVTTNAMLLNAYTPEYMLEVSDAVAVISVISVDGSDTKLDQAVGNTYGKMVIKNTLYGDLKEGTVVNYLKSGGIMTLEEYNKYQIPTMKEKHERLWKESNTDPSKVYISKHFMNDPDIEAGKTYLCYMKYIDSLDKYEIIGLGNGFREINMPKSRSVSSKSINVSEYKILNNDTGKFESLSDYINQYIEV